MLQGELQPGAEVRLHQVQGLSHRLRQRHRASTGDLSLTSHYLALTSYLPCPGDLPQRRVREGGAGGGAARAAGAALRGQGEGAHALLPPPAGPRLAGQRLPGMYSPIISPPCRRCLRS